MRYIDIYIYIHTQQSILVRHGDDIMDFNGDIPGVYPTIYMGLSENDTSELA